jgi:hypothetical protein
MRVEPGAQGIVAESPQEAHWRFRGLAAESPVFLPAYAGKKMRPKTAASRAVLMLSGCWF